MDLQEKSKIYYTVQYLVIILYSTIPRDLSLYQMYIDYIGGLTWKSRV